MAKKVVFVQLNLSVDFTRTRRLGYSILRMLANHRANFLTFLKIQWGHVSSLTSQTGRDG